MGGMSAVTMKTRAANVAAIAIFNAAESVLGWVREVSPLLLLYGVGFHLTVFFVVVCGEGNV